MTDLIISEDLTTAIYIENTVDKVVDEVRVKVEEFKADVTTVKGRAECRKFAFKVVKQKTALVDLANDVTTEWKKSIKVINKKRDEVAKVVADLAEQARKPLTEYEVAEDARLEKLGNGVNAIRDLGSNISVGWDIIPLGEMYEALARVKGVDKNGWQEFQDVALKNIEMAEGSIKIAIDRRIERDEQQAELNQLRADAAERAAEDHKEAELSKAVQVSASIDDGYNREVGENMQAEPVEMITIPRAEYDALIKRNAELENIVSIWRLGEE